MERCQIIKTSGKMAYVSHRTSWKPFEHIVLCVINHTVRHPQDVM